MLNFAKYNSTIPPSAGTWSPDQFAKYCQQISLSETSRIINDNSKSTGLVAYQLRDGMQVKIDDLETFRRFCQTLGHSPSVTEHFINNISDTIDLALWKDREDVLDQLKKLCAQLPDCRAMLTIPIVIGAEAYLNAGASPVPGGGDFILINQGIFFGPLWVDGLEHLFWADKFGISKRQKAELLLDLPPLSLYIMETSQGSPAPLEATIRIGRLKGHQNSYTLDQVFPMLFVLLHELGHIKLGHTEEIRSWPSLNKVSSDIKDQLLAVRRRFEFEADAFASQQMLQFAPKEKTVQKGIAFFFALLHTYERQVITTPPQLRTHPPATDRYHEALKIVCSREEMTFWTSFLQELNQLVSFSLRRENIPEEIDW